MQFGVDDDKRIRTKNILGRFRMIPYDVAMAWYSHMEKNEYSFKIQYIAWMKSQPSQVSSICLGPSNLLCKFSQVGTMWGHQTGLPWQPPRLVPPKRTLTTSTEQASLSPRLTHLPLDKMAVISQTIFSSAFSWMKSLYILIKISLKFVRKGPIDNNPALV